MDASLPETGFSIQVINGVALGLYLVATQVMVKQSIVLSIIIFFQDTSQDSWTHSIPFTGLF